FGYIYDELLFLVEEGHSITLDIQDGVEENVVRSYLKGVLMAILLRQRGFLVLHACCIAQEGQAIAFVGESGWGKSTIAEYFCQKGYDLINDDILALRIVEGEPVLATPGYPEIRLRADSGGRLREDFEMLPRINTRVNKRIRSVLKLPEGTVPVVRLFLLEKDYGAATELETMNTREAIVRLAAHTRVKHLFEYPEHQTLNLQQCATLTRQIQVMRLRRVKSIAMLSSIWEMITQELAESHESQAA
ncbi:MAG TPA: hypothetical protein VKP65_17695, partial [Rhodothermales bacterium]|nr:hypothetical protein [Rhodothermales bacterium]